MGAFLGVDLGGTQIRVLAKDAKGNTLGRASTLTNAAEGPDAGVRRIAETMRAAAKGCAEKRVLGIGIGAPGPVDPWAGVLLSAPNLPGWIDVPICALLSEDFGVPARMGNDANLAALGEHTLGAGHGVNNMVYMTISTGIGGGIIADGKLLLGAKGFAGEFGHQTILESGPLCGCGNCGCLEALAAGPAIARMGRETAAAGRAPRLLALADGSLEAIDARLIGLAAAQGDEATIGIVRTAGTYVGVGLANICNILNPELIVLGGGVTHIGELLFDAVRDTISVRAMPVMRNVSVVPAALGDDVVLLGALALIRGTVEDG